MTEYLSRKLRLLSAISIVMVLYAHMYYPEGTLMPTLNILEKVAGGGVCYIAVPLLYAISGYLFFLRIPYGLKSIEQKMRKRVKTLLVPYLLVNA